MDNMGRKRTAVPNIRRTVSNTLESLSPSESIENSSSSSGLHSSLSSVTIHPVNTKSSESDRDFVTEIDSPSSTDSTGGLLFATAAATSSKNRVSSDVDCETIVGSNDHIQITNGKYSLSRRPSPLMSRIGSSANIKMSYTNSDGGMQIKMSNSTASGKRKGFFDGVKKVAGRQVGEEEVPYLTLLILRLTKSLPGAQYLIHPRVVCVLGALAILLPGIAYTILEKLISDDLDFHYPFFMQLLVQGMAAILLELFTHQYGFFSRIGVIRTVRMVPLALLYGLSLVLNHSSKKVNSVHGTFQVIQGFLPLVIMIMLGSATATAANANMGYLAYRNNRYSSRYSTRGGHGSFLKSNVFSFVCGIALNLFDKGRNSLGGQTPHASSANLLPITAINGSSMPLSSSSPSSRSNSDEDTIDMDSSKPYAGGSGSREGACDARVGRWIIIPLSISVALSIWSPSYHMVAIATNDIEFTTSLAWARSALNIVLSLASLLVNAMLLIGITQYLRQHQGISTATFLRHFTPLCFLVSLVIWPMVEQPAETIEVLTNSKGAVRIFWSCIGVCTLGALSFIAKVAMLKPLVSDGPLGVSVILQIKTISCLAVGWWIYGYAHWFLQVIAFYVAVGCLAIWTLLRLSAKYIDLQPVISPHNFKTSRSRKYSSATN